jgi:hypothetical protein
MMYEVWSCKFREERGKDICEEDNGFGECWADEVESGREDNNVGDIVDEA